MTKNKKNKNIIIGISGASGAIYGIRLLEILKLIESVSTHLVITEAGNQTIRLETDYSKKEVEVLADQVYSINNIASAIASGSFKTAGMIVAPCSMKTLSSIAHSRNDNLLTRAADVTLKERRNLIIIPRESPLHLGHLRLLTQVAEIGAIVVPPMPAFYTKPKTIDQLINQTVQRCFDLLNLTTDEDISPRWHGN